MTATPSASAASSPATPTKPSASSVCKVIFLGAPGVGKTSIINRVMYDQFTRNYETTVGIDYFTKSMTVDEKTVNLQIWDTAGQEQFQSLVPSYVRTSGITIIVYDVSDPKTLASAQKWYDYVVDIRGNDARCVLAGNKLDLPAANISEDEIKKFIEPHKIPHIQVSAKTGEKVTDLFKLVVREISDSDLAKNDSITVKAQPIVTTTTQESNAGCFC